MYEKLDRTLQMTLQELCAVQEELKKDVHVGQMN
jgi:hypothetical protein